MPKNGDVELSDLLIQLRIANRLSAARLRGRGSMGQQELIALLANTGASAQEIADLLHTTPATVSATLQRLKRKRR